MSTKSSFERLKKDSADIDRALDEFMAERLAAAQLQAEALRSYEEEMENIGVGDMDDIEKEMNEVDVLGGSMSAPSLVAPTSNSVDHNIRRLMKLTGDGEGQGDEGDEYDDDEYEEDAYDDDDDFDDGAGLGQGSLARTMESMGRTMKKTKKKKEEYIKRSIPAPEVKKEMRSKLFGLLSQQRMEERDLENELASLREEEEPNDAMINEIADMLFDKQKEHFSRIVEFVEDYQPHTSGKAWGGDPEYFKMLRTMKERVDRRFERDLMAMGM